MEVGFILINNSSANNSQMIINIMEEKLPQKITVLRSDYSYDGSIKMWAVQGYVTPRTFHQKYLYVSNTGTQYSGNPKSVTLDEDGSFSFSYQTRTSDSSVLTSTLKPTNTLTGATKTEK